MRNYILRLQSRISLNPKAFRIYSILRLFVILTAFRCYFTRNFESLALCILSLLLFLMPSFFEEKLQVEIPASFQICIYLFVYAAEILGEINKFYTQIHGWDTMLHTINGFLCAAIGISLAAILNRGSKNISLSAFYVALMGFCFSMTIGVLWEFFEFSMDQFFALDMQKDFVINSISSVTLDPSNSQVPYLVKDIIKTTIETSDGKIIEIAGYLDIGIIDTMKDLLVNFVGAVAFSILGYVYEKNKETKSFAAGFLIRPMDTNEIIETNERITENIEKVEKLKHHRKNK